MNIKYMMQVTEVLDVSAVGVPNHSENTTLQLNWTFSVIAYYDGM